MIDVEQLRSKILDLAISGKLVPQDPNDEPASVLLERIQKEKEALVKAGKIKKADPPSVIYKGSDNRYYEKAPSFEHPIDISNEIPCSLPEGWAWTRLSNICASIEYGLSYSAKKDGENKYLRITDIQDGEVNWENVPYVTIAPGEERFYLRSGDIVFARTGATVGKSFLIMKVPERSVFASYLIRISPIDCRISQYISFFFGSSFYWKQITNTSVGTGQPNCNGTKLANLLIPFPPLKVQEKINANLQNILPVVMRIGREQKKISFVATALKREILKSFFASDKSYYSKNNENNCSGDLFTAEKYCQEIQSGNINEKRQKILVKDIRIDSQNRGWIPLSFIAEDIFGGGTPSKAEPNYWNGDIPWCSVKDLGESLIVYSTQDTITQKGLENSASKIVKKGGLILCTRLSVGEIRIAGKDMAINQDLKGVILNKVIWPMYFVYFMSSVKLPTSGTTVKGVTLKNLLSTPFPYVPMERQIEISKRIEFLYSLIDKGINQKK